MNPTWTQVTLQWLLILAIISILPITAFRFRTIAITNNRRGWPYFLLGFGVGFFALVLAMLVLSLALYRYELEAESEVRSGILFLSAVALAYVIMFLFIRLFRQRIEKRKSESTILDADL